MRHTRCSREDEACPAVRSLIRRGAPAVSTAAVLLATAGLFAFMTFTVKLMLGVGGDAENFEYLTRGV